MKSMDAASGVPNGARSLHGLILCSHAALDLRKLDGDNRIHRIYRVEFTGLSQCSRFGGSGLKPESGPQEAIGLALGGPAPGARPRARSLLSRIVLLNEKTKGGGTSCSRDFT